MATKIINQKLVNRWNDVMNSICCEHVAIGTNLSELESHGSYNRIDNSISTDWMIKEAQYWLSCYYESGHIRCDERFEDEQYYKIWVSETGKLKRLIALLEKNKDTIVAEFE